MDFKIGQKVLIVGDFAEISHAGIVIEKIGSTYKVIHKDGQGEWAEKIIRYPFDAVYTDIEKAKNHITSNVELCKTLLQNALTNKWNELFNE